MTTRTPTAREQDVAGADFHTMLTTALALSETDEPVRARSLAFRMELHAIADDYSTGEQQAALNRLLSMTYVPLREPVDCRELEGGIAILRWELKREFGVGR